MHSFCGRNFTSVVILDTKTVFLFSLRSALVGEIDEDLDRRIDFSALRAEPLNPVVH